LFKIVFFDECPNFSGGDDLSLKGEFGKVDGFEVELFGKSKDVGFMALCLVSKGVTFAYKEIRKGEVSNNLLEKGVVWDGGKFWGEGEDNDKVGAVGLKATEFLLEGADEGRRGVGMKGVGGMGREGEDGGSAPFFKLF
jgi:hypothetical protein